MLTLVSCHVLVRSDEGTRAWSVKPSEFFPITATFPAKRLSAKDFATGERSGWIEFGQHEIAGGSNE